MYISVEIKYFKNNAHNFSIKFCNLRTTKKALSTILGKTYFNRILVTMRQRGLALIKKLTIYYMYITQI